MKNISLLLFTLLLIQYSLFAQCDIPVAPAINNCNLAPLLCGGIDGYCSILSEEDSTAVFPGCSSSIFNNTDWISFIAGSELISIAISFDNCLGIGTNGNIGAQAVIYKGCPFDQEEIAIFCDCTVDDIILNSEAYIIGERYYLAVDGCGGDICDYEILVLEGSTFIGEPDTEIAATICEGEAYQNGDWIFDEVGTYDFIYSDSADCDSLIHLLIDVLPNSISIFDTLLEVGGMYNGTIYLSDTTLETTYTGINGCDSIVYINIDIPEIVSANSPGWVNNLNIFPNPTKRLFYIELNTNEAVDLKVEIYNTYGQKVSFISLHQRFAEGEHHIELDSRELPAGAYFVHFETNKDSFIKTLIITR